MQNILDDMKLMNEVFWINPNLDSRELNSEKIVDAEERLRRFAPYIASVFPETKEAKGMIESPLTETKQFKQFLETTYRSEIKGRLLVKWDSHLPISGSIKARGGIYEVLKLAENIAVKHGLLENNDDYRKLTHQAYRELFSNYAISVGSTGNLGLSIGIISRMLGFQVTVHMSHDAKQWKKAKLRELGAIVKEYKEDYSKAVAAGREEALQQPTCYFIDDENSADLFFGYATAALRLKAQLHHLSVKVDNAHPLFVYLPCGVGGGPGGITYGLKQVFGEAVHCFFAEPTHSPCMLLGLVSGKRHEISVEEIGLDNRTEADGLAVARPSKLVSEQMNHLLSGIYTIDDARLFQLLQGMHATEGIFLEPSALAGAYGPIFLHNEYVKKQRLSGKMEQATHIIWATGGSMVPAEVISEYLRKK